MLSCNVELAIERKDTLAKPTKASAMSSTARTGERAAKDMNAPKINDARIIARTPVLPRAAVHRPPMIAPMPMAAINTP